MIATYDVAILGAGVAGLCLARHLLRHAPGLRIGLVDAGPLPADRARSKVGESSTEASSWYLAERLGLATHLEAEQLKKLGLRFFLAAAPGKPFAARPEFGLMTPGSRTFAVPFVGLNPTTWQLQRGRLEATLLEELVAAGADVRAGTRAEVRLGRPHRLALTGAGGAETWTARWVVDASGGAWVVPADREEDRALDHAAQAAWFWVPRRVDPDTFSADPAFRARIPADLRWRSTNHLVGRGYWVWLIALADGSTSVGLVSDPRHHDAAHFADLDACAAWLTTHEPELAAALADAGPATGFARRGWVSHARRTLVSPERWAVTGDTAAFLDPLFSSGLDLVAIGNELLVPQILADLAGHDIGRDARRASGLFARMVEQYLCLYQGSYAVMGHPRAMMAKLVWDLAVYFGFLAPVVRSGLLTDDAFMVRVAHVGRGIATLQGRVSAVLVAWAERPAPDGVSGNMDQGMCAPMSSLVQRLRDADAMAGDAAGSAARVAALTQNLRLIEQLAVAIFQRAAADLGLSAPDGPLNPYAIGVDPAAWARDGLTGGANPVAVEPWVAEALEVAWLRA